MSGNAKKKSSTDSIASKNVRKIRDIKGFSQEYMAQKLDISQAAYSKLEQGKTNFTDTLKERIAYILEVDKELLDNFSDNMIFNNCTQHGNIGNNNTYYYEREKLEVSDVEQFKSVLKEFRELINEKNKIISDKDALIIKLEELLRMK